MQATWQRGAELLRARIVTTAHAVGDAFPRHADPPTGQWTTSTDGDWSGGYWIGLCWLAASPRGDDPYLGWARRWGGRLRRRVTSPTVFRGGLFYYGAALGALLHLDANARADAIAAAEALAATFDTRAAVVPLTPADAALDVGSVETRIDTLPGIALLPWAAREAARPEWRDIAVMHARRHVELCVRAEGSVSQAASLDAATGTATRRYCRDGVHAGSTWARAQAWAILGYTLMYQWTGEPEFLDVAERTADWWLLHGSHDHVAFWDFDDPASFNATRDTAATAIVAAALLKLAALTADDARRLRYRREAEASATALVERYLDQRGVLSHGCDDRRGRVATKNELIWGSYHLLEALEVLCGRLAPTAI
jgi:unsaturated chondroitin disaccharide hydrolase